MRRRSSKVSVLFSEPKIPQFWGGKNTAQHPLSFSALQRAENSSIGLGTSTARAPRAFQCSSASRKFLNIRSRARCGHLVRVSVLFSEPKIPQSPRAACAASVRLSFSALQRAENSSIRPLSSSPQVLDAFQCSSASRKFLN